MHSSNVVPRSVRGSCVCLAVADDHPHRHEKRQELRQVRRDSQNHPEFWPKLRMDWKIGEDIPHTLHVGWSLADTDRDIRSESARKMMCRSCSARGATKVCTSRAKQPPHQNFPHRFRGNR